MTECLVRIEKLSFVHESGKIIFDDISCTIARGKITAIMGPSGTGKTTLLRLIGAQITPTAGTVTINDQNVHRLSRNALFELRKKIGLMMQSGGLFTHLSVYDNIAFPLREHTGLSESFIKTLVMMKLQMVGLRGAQHLMPHELSGGMSRRVALARATALEPALVMLDEPFTGQDPISMGILVKLIRELTDHLQLTTIIVSHDVQETLSIADYVYVISDTKIIGEGTPEQIVQNASPKLQQFLQGQPDGPIPFDYETTSLEQDFLQAGATAR